MLKKKISVLSLILLFTNSLLAISCFTYVFAEQAKPLKVAEVKKTSTFLDKFTLKSQLELKYDTNVYNYSRDDISEYESYTNLNRFDQVKSIGDFITSPLMGIEFKDKFFTHTLIANLEIEPHFYSQNKIKDYESYRFRLRQYLEKREYLEFNYSRIPKFFLRNLYDRDSAEYRKGYFDVDRYLIGYRRDLNKSLSARIRYLHEQNNYNTYFNEYDMKADALNLSLWHKLNNYFRSWIYFEFERADAKGDLDSTSRVEFNPSFDKYEIGLRGTATITKRLDFYMQYVFAFKDYTTNNAMADDSYHADRQDKIQEIGLGLEYKISQDLNMFARYEYSIKDVNTASEDPSVINASILGYEKNTVSLGVAYRF